MPLSLSLAALVLTGGMTLSAASPPATTTREEPKVVESSVFVLPGSRPAPPAVVPVAMVRETVRETARDPIEDRPPVLRRSPKLPEDFETDPAIYLQRRLGAWNEADARGLMGEPARHRFSFDTDKNLDGQIYTFADPSKKYRELELDFDKETGYLRSVFVYPWNMKWDECRRMWGAKVTTTEASNGRRFHSYENRRLDVLVDKTGNVISFGLY